MTGLGPRFRYRIPLIGPVLRRRDLRRFGRELGEALRRGLDQASADIAREIAALGERDFAANPFTGLIAALGGEETPPEDGPGEESS